MGIINWKAIDKKSRKLVAVWSAVGLLGSGGLGTVTYWVYGLAQESFETYVTTLATTAVIKSIDHEKSHKTTSLSYKMAERFEIPREDVAYFLADRIEMLQNNNDSIEAFRKRLKPWAEKMIKTTLVGPQVDPAGNEVYVEFNAEEYRIRRYKTFPYWTDDNGHHRDMSGNKITGWQR